MTKYNVLLVDADDTLFDFDAAEDQAIRDTCMATGIAADAGTIAVYKEINAALWRAFERKEVTQDELRLLRFSRFLERIGIEHDIEAMSEQYIADLSQQAQEISGAHDFLRKASALMPVIVVTNGISSVQRSRFARSPLKQYIRDFVISAEVGFSKPDPRMIARAIELSGVDNARALMIGDEPRSDIAAANAAGVDSCWFNPRGRTNETTFRPTYEVRALAEVFQWL